MQFFRLDMKENEATILFRHKSMEFHPDGYNPSDENFRNLKTEYEDFKAIKRNWAEIKEFFAPKQKIIIMPAVPEPKPQAPAKANMKDIIDSGVNFMSEINKSIQNVNKVIRSAKAPLKRKPRKK